jgi:ribosomal protein L7Ae-like RNA K-turn-binding protein
MEREVRLLGIARKAGLLQIGDESVSAAAVASRARLILSASDASENSTRRAKSYAEASGKLHLVLPFTKFELSECLGRGAPGMLAVTDVGIAASLTSMLAARDTARYGLAAAQMAERNERARRRRKKKAGSDTIFNKGRNKL